MGSSRTARVLLQYEIDQASAKEAAKSARLLNVEIGKLSQAERDAAREALVLTKNMQATSKGIKAATDSAKSLEAALDMGLRRRELDAIAADFNRIERETGSTAQALDAVKKKLDAIGASEGEIAGVARQIESLNAAAANQRVAGLQGKPREFLGGQTFRTVGFQLRSIPGGGVPETIGRLSPLLDILAGQADKAGGSLLPLISGLGLAGAAVAGIVIAFDRFNKSIEAAQKTLTGAIAAQNAYYDAVRDNTSAQVREQIQELERTERVARQQAMETQAAIDEAFRQAQEAFGDATARALDAGGKLPTAQLREQLDELNATSTGANQSIGRLVDGINAGAFAANDAAAAFRELSAELLSDFQNAVQLELRAQNMLAEDRRKRIEEIYLEGAILQQFGEANRENADIVAFVNDRIEELNKEGAILGRVLESLADRAAAAAFRNEVLSDQTDALFDQQTRYAEALQSVHDATQAYNEALQASEDKLTEIANDAEAKRLEAFADANEKQLELDEDYNDKLEKQAEDHAKRIDKIMRDANNAIADAIGNRDALAAYLAMRKAAEDIADEEERDKERLKQIEEAYAKQQEAIDKALNKQLARIQQAADKATEAERQRYAKEEQIRQQAILRAHTDAFNAENQLKAIRDTAQAGRVIQEYNHYQTLDSLTGAWLNNIAFRFGYFFQQIAGMVPAGGTGSIGAPGGGSGIAPTPFAAGGGAARTPLNQAIDARLAYHVRRVQER